MATGVTKWILKHSFGGLRRDRDMHAKNEEPFHVQRSAFAVSRTWTFRRDMSGFQTVGY